MSWIENFTIAIVEEHHAKIGKLIYEMPEFKDINEAKCARALIKEALNVMEKEKHKTQDAMEKLKKTRAFITSANIVTTHKKEYRG
ncbi:MAG: hypothetical protein H6Q35_233 [Proteobacteria bacterium]|nr:hypothetical protein [Pseudomonadota bacterium]